MSDFTIFLSYYEKAFPEKKSFAKAYQIRASKMILQYDPHWVNAYLTMIANSTKVSDRERWISELRKQYIGDDERWKNTVEPFINSYY